MSTIIYPVTDLDRAKALFGRLLAAEPSMDEPYYVGYDSDGDHLGLDPNGQAKGLTGPVRFWDVDDLDTAVKGLLDVGAITVQEAQDVGGGLRIATVKDPDGNMVGLRQQP